MSSLQLPKIGTQTSVGQAPTAKQANAYAAIVIAPNEKTKDFGSLLAIARNVARKREHVQENPVIRTIMFASDLGVYVAVYEIPAQNMRKEDCERPGGS